MKSCVVQGCTTRPEYVWVQATVGEVLLCCQHVHLAITKPHDRGPLVRRFAGR